MPIYMNIGGNTARQKLVCHEVHFALNPNLSGLVSSPHDQATGQASGKRSHGQVKILYSVGPHTHSLPPLSPNQLLPAVQFQFTKTNPNGSEQVHHLVNLGKAKVAGILQHVAGKGGVLKGFVLELLEVEQTYRQISWTFTNGGKAFNDDWH